MGRRWYTRNRVPPEVSCRGGCGRTRRTWSRSWLCRFCLLDDRQASPESFRATRRRLAGRCAVCGGPWPDGSGCEFCPKVEPEGAVRLLEVEPTPEDRYGHAAGLM